MKTARFLLAKGFTLVELLIVIALIGVLAVAVLAAINPLEQLNRARDTGMESDASQLLAAIDRFYASQEKFPWVFQVGCTNCQTDNDAAFGFFSAKDQGVGVCGANCTTKGILLDQYELKSEFLNRKFIKALDATEADLLYISKDEGASTSVYACWVPTSQAKRSKATWGITLDDPVRAARTCTTTPGGTDWTDIAEACMVCIPQ